MNANRHAVTGDFSGLKTGETTFTLKTCKAVPLGGKCTGWENGKNREVAGEMVIPFSLSSYIPIKASKKLALLFKPQGKIILCMWGI